MIPAQRRLEHPGKHETYIFGQGSADGTACIGCAWQTHKILSGVDAVAQHDHDMHRTHQHDDWVAIEQTEKAGRCPYGQLPETDLSETLLATIQGSAHRAIVFTDIDSVPVGSVGYLTPGNRQVMRVENGWLHDGRDFEIPVERKYTFTSQSGPANDRKLAGLLEAALIPEHHVLVDFEIITDHKPGDWESCQPSYDFSAPANPRLLGHHLNDAELARLYFEIESVGSLGESDAYGDLDRLITKISEKPAMAPREQTAADKHSWLNPAERNDNAQS